MNRYVHWTIFNLARSECHTHRSRAATGTPACLQAGSNPKRLDRARAMRFFGSRSLITPALDAAWIDGVAMNVSNDHLTSPEGLEVFLPLMAKTNVGLLPKASIGRVVSVDKFDAASDFTRSGSFTCHIGKRSTTISRQAMSMAQLVRSIASLSSMTKKPDVPRQREPSKLAP